MRVIRFLSVNHPEAQVRELSHGGSNGRHLRFAARQESLVERFHLGVTARGDYRALRLLYWQTKLNAAVDTVFKVKQSDGVCRVL